MKYQTDLKWYDSMKAIIERHAEIVAPGLTIVLMCIGFVFITLDLTSILLTAILYFFVDHLVYKYIGA